VLARPTTATSPDLRPTPLRTGRPPGSLHFRALAGCTTATRGPRDCRTSIWPRHQGRRLETVGACHPIRIGLACAIVCSERGRPFSTRPPAFSLAMSRSVACRRGRRHGRRPPASSTADVNGCASHPSNLPDVADARRSRTQPPSVSFWTIGTRASARRSTRWRRRSPSAAIRPTKSPHTTALSSRRRRT
jgi:hypothetical protein